MPMGTTKMTSPVTTSAAVASSSSSPGMQTGFAGSSVATASILNSATPGRGSNIRSSSPASMPMRTASPLRPQSSPLSGALSTHTMAGGQAALGLHGGARGASGYAAPVITVPAPANVTALHGGARPLVANRVGRSLT